MGIELVLWIQYLDFRVHCYYCVGYTFPCASLLYFMFHHSPQWYHHEIVLFQIQGIKVCTWERYVKHLYYVSHGYHIDKPYITQMHLSCRGEDPPPTKPHTMVFITLRGWSIFSSLSLERLLGFSTLLCLLVFDLCPLSWSCYLLELWCWVHDKCHILVIFGLKR